MLDDDGFEIVHGVISAGDLLTLRQALAVRKGAGRRGLLGHPAVASIVRAPALLGLMTRRLGGDARPVKAILFDKARNGNWLVPWHQDVTVAVLEPHDVAGFGPWTVKEGAHHVLAPACVLEQMLTIRIHLDDCDETNGALRVLPGTHRLGRLDSTAISALRERGHEVICRARAGDALLMRPLLLHASGRSTSGRPRRVLHIDFACGELPLPLKWSDAG